MSGEEQIPETVARFVKARKSLLTDEGIEKGLLYKPRPTDVILSTAIKSGTTLTQQVKISSEESSLY